MISHQYNFIFIHIPKCAGTSLEKAFGHFSDFEGRDGQDHRTIRTVNPYIQPFNYFKSKENLGELLRTIYWKVFSATNPKSNLKLSKNEYEDYFKFTIVRNPYTRAYSWYKNVIRDPIHRKSYNVDEGTSFEEFLQENIGKSALRKQSYWLKDYNGIIKMDQVIKFEDLEGGFKELCLNLGVTGLNLPHEIKGQTEDYLNSYNENTKRLIKEFYKEDFELFGYDL